MWSRHYLAMFLQMQVTLLAVHCKWLQLHSGWLANGVKGMGHQFSLIDTAEMQEWNVKAMLNGNVQKDLGL